MKHEKELAEQELEQVHGGRGRSAIQRGGTCGGVVQLRDDASRYDHDMADQHGQAQSFDGPLVKGGGRAPKASV